MTEVIAGLIGVAVGLVTVVLAVWLPLRKWPK